MSTSVRLYPHRVSEGLVLTLCDVVDPFSGNRVAVTSPRPVDETDADAPTGAPAMSCYIADPDARWKQLDCQVEVSLDADELGRVSPPGVDLMRVSRLTVLVTCPSTKVRRACTLSSASRGRWTGSFSVAREDIERQVLLTPQLVLVKQLTAPPGFGSVVGTLLAVGPRFRLDLTLRARMGEVDVDVRWEDFAGCRHPWRCAHPEDVFHLDLSEEPVVYLNSRYAELGDLLESQAKRGPQAALRDLALRLVAQPVMMQLGVAALAGLELDDDETGATLPGGWRGAVLRAMLPDLYPGESDAAAAFRAVQDTKDEFGTAELMSRLGSHVQQTVTLHQAVESGVRAFESSRNVADGDDD